MQEGKYQLDILDDTADFQAYKLIILPDNIGENLLEAIHIPRTITPTIYCPVRGSMMA